LLVQPPPPPPQYKLRSSRKASQIGFFMVADGFVNFWAPELEIIVNIELLDEAAEMQRWPAH
jgi:hypothetical protein